LLRGAPCAPDAGHTVFTGAETPHHPHKPMTKNQAISLMILAQVAEGKTIQQAFDAVIGEGAYKRLAGEVWEALQPKA
jgi:hypothetical protein